MPPAGRMSERRTAFIGALLVALGPISLALYTPAMPTLVQVFGTDVATVKLTLTLYFAGFAAAQLVCGPLSDAVGRRPVVVAFTALYLAASLVAAVAPSIGWLLAARLVQGVGAAAGVAIARAIVRDLFTGQDSARVMNTIGLLLGVAPSLAPTIGGVILDLAGWQAIFALMILYGAALVGIFLLAVPETLAAADPAAIRPRRLVAGYGRLFADPRFLRPSLVLGFAMGGIYANATMLPFTLIDGAGMTPTAFGFAMLAQSGSFTAGAYVVRRLLRRAAAEALVPWGLGLAVSGAGLVAVLLRLWEPGFAVVMGPVAVYAFGIAFIMPAMTTASLAPFPAMAGAAAALAGFLQIGGGLVGSVAAAAIADPAVALASVLPAMTAVAVAAYWGLKRPAERRAAAERPPR